MVEEHDRISYIDHEGERLAVTVEPGSGPGLFFLPGLGSDMTGSKALCLRELARAYGCGFTSLDYSGHGRSSGTFAAGTLTRWLSDSVAVFDGITGADQVIVGSSMGAWLGLHLALLRPERVKGFVGIAAAPDFTRDLVMDRLDEGQRRALEDTGFLHAPSAYGSLTLITKALVESGEALRLLGAPIHIDGPVRLLHGLRDTDVPWSTSLRLAEALTSPDVQLHLVKDGEHRLSREPDLALLGNVVRGLLGRLLPDQRTLEKAATSWSRL